MGRREENKRRTRQALLDTGLALFREEGFDETRVQDIVDRVGVSPATFFNYFPSKDSILEAQAEHTADLYNALLRHELDRTEATVAERLEQITSVLAQSLENDAAISSLMARKTGLFFGPSGPKAEKDRASQQLLANLFAQGQAAGEVDPHADPVQLAELYTALITLTATNWLIDWWGTSNQPLHERLVDGLHILWNGASTR